MKHCNDPPRKRRKRTGKNRYAKYLQSKTGLKYQRCFDLYWRAWRAGWRSGWKNRESLLELVNEYIKESE